MDPNTLLGEFTGPEKFLLHVLMSGPTGVRKASYVYHKQQRSKGSLQNILETFCREEISPRSDEPFKTQLKRDMGYPEEDPLYTPLCNQRINELCQELGGSSWTKCFSGRKVAPVSESGMLEMQRKRKANFHAPDSDVEETEHQCKRLKVASPHVEQAHGNDFSAAMEERTGEELYGEDVPSTNPHQLVCPASQKEQADLPVHIKDSIPRIKELLECPTEWDQGSAEVFTVLNACDTIQVEMLCALLGLSDAAEQTLPKLCSSLLALSPDLSHSTAATLIKSLLLRKVLSLIEPASRCFVTAVTSLCCRYPRATLHALIRPVLEERNIAHTLKDCEAIFAEFIKGCIILQSLRKPLSHKAHVDLRSALSALDLLPGNPQAELVNRIIEDCLEPHYRLLVFEMMFKIAWSDAALSIIHTLLDTKLEFTAELFAHFTEHLVKQAPQFTKSMKFAKMMLTVLTKYNAQVTEAQKHSLSCCLSLNETFLKKSLQAALKRITHT